MMVNDFVENKALNKNETFEILMENHEVKIFSTDLSTENVNNLQFNFFLFF